MWPPTALALESISVHPCMQSRELKRCSQPWGTGASGRIRTAAQGRPYRSGKALLSRHGSLGMSGSVSGVCACRYVCMET